VDVRLTSTARDQLLAAVVLLREDDRAAAGRFVQRVAGALAELGRDPDAGVDVSSERSLTRDGDGFRFLYRVRGEVVWVLAVWPEDNAPS
jgi:plasmid stabilization system protein ParE